ncbi:ferredoxin reductase [Amycolatopsis minnesotensis]|uniref:ferredoxin reductase n=1 Tax=Amycolatopsis minnesotensis TaxID=337894 RepID=UPI0031E1B514
MRNPSFARAGWRHVRRVLDSRVVSALTVPHGVDRYLGLVNPMWSVREVRAVVAGVAHHTADSVTLTLRPNANWRGARAGQHVRLAVEIDGVRRTRCFSVASSADRADGTIEITAKVNPAGTVSRYLKEAARPGLMVALSQAEGEFVLPEVLPEHVLLISGGSGITPVMSLVRTLTDRCYPGRITFLHYTRAAGDVVYRAELAAAASSRLDVVFSCTAEPGAGRLDGRFRREHLLEVAPGYADAMTYVCGPGPLLDAVRAMWVEEGIEDRLLAERFTAAAIGADVRDAGGELRFTRSGITTPNDGRTVLEQAEGAGLSPQFGCRMGVCHSCSSVKTSGSVRNVLDGALTTETGAWIQLCVTAPCGDVEVDI